MSEKVVAKLKAGTKTFTFTAQDVADLLVQVPVSDLFQILGTNPDIHVFGITGIPIDNGRDPPFRTRLALTYSKRVDPKLGSALRETMVRLYGEEPQESPDGFRVVLLDPQPIE